jgi:hypothetical protein
MTKRACGLMLLSIAAVRKGVQQEYRCGDQAAH